MDSSGWSRSRRASYSALGHFISCWVAQEEKYVLYHLLGSWLVYSPPKSQASARCRNSCAIRWLLFPPHIPGASLANSIARSHASRKVKPGGVSLSASPNSSSKAAQVTSNSSQQLGRSRRGTRVALGATIATLVAVEVCGVVAAGVAAGVMLESTSPALHGRCHGRGGGGCRRACRGKRVCRSATQAAAASDTIAKNPNKMIFLRRSFPDSARVLPASGTEQRRRKRKVPPPTRG